VRFDGKVLALDIASTTGWAFGKPGTKPFCGSILLAKPGTSRAGVHRAFRTWLDRVWSDPLPGGSLAGQDPFHRPEHEERARQVQDNAALSRSGLVHQQ
jgi:hypothetical protein